MQFNTVQWLVIELNYSFSIEVHKLMFQKLRNDNDIIMSYFVIKKKMSGIDKVIEVVLVSNISQPEVYRYECDFLSNSHVQ